MSVSVSVSVRVRVRVRVRARARAREREGLQHSLALLEQYCEEWALTLNLDKTRVMVFQKKARSQGSRYQFSYGGEVLEHSTSYSYLGIQISALGGFSLAVKALYEKIRHVYIIIFFTEL